MNNHSAGMKIKFNGQMCEVRRYGKRYSKNLNNQGEGGGRIDKWGLFNEAGEMVGSINNGYLGHHKIMKDGKVIGSVRLDDSHFSETK
jgi:hypothetical protein